MAGQGAGEPERPRLGQLLLYLWRLSRPEVWTTSFLPAYVGWVLATEELVPGLATWAAFWAEATATGATTGAFWEALRATAVVGQDLLVGLLVLGPLLWTATLLINDVHDLAGDRVNPRKASSPLVQGLVTRRWAHQAAYGVAGLTLVMASLLGTSFLLLVGAALVLAWLYSVPPVRLKEVPGGDVLVNAVGIGALSGMAGWTLAAPLAGFPFELLPQGLLVATAVYVPTTLVDRAPDEQVGYTTLATRLGHERAYRVGFGAWVAANAGALLLAWNGWLLPRAFLPVLVVFVPLLVWQYHRFIGQAKTPEAMVEGILLCAVTFLAVNLLFALMYTGLWVG